MKHLRSFKIFESQLHQQLSQKAEDLKELEEYLISFNVPLEKYGTKGFKTVNHLLDEIQEGETKLVTKGNELHRYVEFIGAKVVYIDSDGTKWRLYEEKQVFKDGRVRIRKSMPYSLAEKFKSGEDPKKGIIRGIKEELKVTVTPDQFTFYNETELINNDDYPGIISHHKGHEFLVVFNSKQYQEEGYIEHQADKDVYFEWRKL